MDDNKCIDCGSELDENGKCPNCDEEEMEMKEEEELDDEEDVFMGGEE